MQAIKKTKWIIKLKNKKIQAIKKIEDNIAQNNNVKH